MRKVIFTALLLMVISSRAISQLNDWGKVWIQGAGATFQTVFQPNPSNSILDSNKDLYFGIGHSNICDSSGQLILCSDGYRIYDKNLDLLDGGDTLMDKQWVEISNGFAVDAQTSLFLPMKDKKYYFVNCGTSDSLFEVYFGDTPSVYSGRDRLYYHKIDMGANGGHGKVTKRMQVLYDKPGLSGSQMMACRHGNGTDWWLLKQASDTNVVYKYLFTQDSVYGPFIQGFSEPHFSLYNLAGQSMFSQDGTKYASTARGAFKVFVADFDRCTGALRTYPKNKGLPKRVELCGV